MFVMDAYNRLVLKGQKGSHRMADNEIDRGTTGLGSSKKRYSAFSLARNAMSYHQNWQQAGAMQNQKQNMTRLSLVAAGTALPQLITSHLSMA